MLILDAKSKFNCALKNMFRFTKIIKPKFTENFKPKTLFILFLHVIIRHLTRMNLIYGPDVLHSKQ